MMNNDVLKHVGVLGMHWGKRKAAKSSRPSKPSSPEHKNKEILKKKKLHEMSNAELKTLNERLQLEKSYKELTKAERSAGKKFVMDFLENTAKQVISTVVSKQVSELMKKVLN